MNNNRQNRLNQIRHNSNALKNLMDKLDDQHVKFKVDMPVYKKDYLNFSNTFPMDNRQEQINDSFIVDINPDRIKIEQQQINQYKKAMNFDENTNEQTIYNETNFAKDSYTLTKFDNDEEQAYLFMDNKHITADNEIQMIDFTIDNEAPLSNLVNSSLQLTQSDMDILINSIDEHLNMTKDQQKQTRLDYEKTKYQAPNHLPNQFNKHKSFTTVEHYSSDKVRQIQTIENRLSILCDSTYIPINRNFNIEIDGKPMKTTLKIAERNRYAYIDINLYDSQNRIDTHFNEVCDKLKDEIDLCNDLLESYDYVDDLNELDEYLNENGPLTDNLKNALQQKYENDKLNKQNMSNYDEVDKYEKLLDFEGLSDELQK